MPGLDALGSAALFSVRGAQAGGLRAVSHRMTTSDSAKKIIIHLTTYPPRECGIATFSNDLIAYCRELFSESVEAKVVAMSRPSIPVPAYPPEVLFGITDDRSEEYRAAAERINAMPEVALVSIQHEFGIYGGAYGDYLLEFLDVLARPVSVTFHTVLPEPPEGMKDVVARIAAKAGRIIVMTERSKRLLESAYGIPSEKLQVIPHGIHPQSYRAPAAGKAPLGLSLYRVLMTFGLLGPGKGIEHAIAALPAVVERFPDTRYVIAGATHPVVLARDGEAYRRSLEELAERLGVATHVEFRNEYLSTDALLGYLCAADLYLSVSQNPAQAVSGTLSYALGSGRAVLSTAFAQAEELITPDVGVLVGFGGHEEIAARVCELFADPTRLEEMGKTAYFRTRGMTWPNVARSYMGVYASLSPALEGERQYLMPVTIDYLLQMTDGFGVFQFARLSEPDARYGYTLDDNARALVTMCWYGGDAPDAQTVQLAGTYLSFIERALSEGENVVNYFTAGHAPHPSRNESENLEDAVARALWALSVAAGSALPQELTARASALYARERARHAPFHSPRAAAFSIKALAAEARRGASTEESRALLRTQADSLVGLFEKASDSGWQWFEESLTYSNAVLPEALLRAYAVLGEPRYLEVGKAALDFLIAHSFEGSVCVPIGQAGWYKKGGEKVRYDQQPEEVSALVLALRQMTMLSDSPAYRDAMFATFDWFFGNNLAQQVVYTHGTGGCYDGLGEHGINLNQGSESTIAYLLARLSFEDHYVQRNAGPDAGNAVL